jgi:GR25 family glycosyltransferase involved in LPS biosynthesis
MNIAYINLDRNTERNEHILNEIKNNITNYKTLKRIQAVDGKDFTDEEKEYWGSRKNFRTMCNIKERVYGRVGCLLSHKKLLEYALENELDNILILEDDVNIRDIPDINDIPKDTDILYFGIILQRIKEEEEKQTGKYIKIDTEYIKVFGTHGFYIPSLEKIKEIYNILFSLKRNGSIDCDIKNQIHPRGNSYILNPCPITDSELFISEIGYKEGRYKNLKKQYC